MGLLGVQGVFRCSRLFLGWFRDCKASRVSRVFGFIGALGLL